MFGLSPLFAAAAAVARASSSSGEESLLPRHAHVHVGPCQLLPRPHGERIREMTQPTSDFGLSPKFGLGRPPRFVPVRLQSLPSSVVPVTLVDRVEVDGGAALLPLPLPLRLRLRLPLKLKSVLHGPQYLPQRVDLLLHLSRLPFLGGHGLVFLSMTEVFRLGGDVPAAAAAAAAAAVVAGGMGRRWSFLVAEGRLPRRARFRVERSGIDGGTIGRRCHVAVVVVGDGGHGFFLIPLYRRLVPLSGRLPGFY
mmetsp:Transcript_8469/g.25581  ORF Transcript_8469/g.25581 Transcript_8469/m.25581 type:complete len:252 (-) Transcript_8469:103-858(-)